jgi:3'-phosphoadenosine 5'-phosphosulfate sulfotransferase (PAPS reductase)/FAD synthetase
MAICISACSQKHHLGITREWCAACVENRGRECVRCDGDGFDDAAGNCPRCNGGGKEPLQVVAFSGGDDSTAMALKMAEDGEDFVLLFTPAGNEPKELFDHIELVREMVGKELVQPPNKPLDYWIDHFKALPSWRMRWCTRLIKILPCIEWLEAHPGSVLCVGLRADEDTREGLYGDYATYRYPLREWGWNDADVQAYNASRGVKVPKRTNCELCYDQRIGEWWELWRENPAMWAEGERREAETGHTFRSSGRDTWPAQLIQLRSRFEAGDVPPGVELNLSLFDDEQGKRCRVCSL